MRVANSSAVVNYEGLRDLPTKHTKTFRYQKKWLPYYLLNISALPKLIKFDSRFVQELPKLPPFVFFVCFVGNNLISHRPLFRFSSGDVSPFAWILDIGVRISNDRFADHETGAV